MDKRIFISSTFNDFNTERDIFKTSIEPYLNAKLKGINVRFIDLRWGVDTLNEQDRNIKILSRCSEAVNSAKPFFILLVGDNYGTPLDETCYENFCYSKNIEKEQYAPSLTEVEATLSGMFTSKDKSTYLVLFRNLTNKEELSGSFYYKAKYQERLAKFKEKIRKSGVDIIEYDATFSNSGRLVINHFESFVEKVTCSIMESLIKIESTLEDETIWKTQKNLFDELENNISLELVPRLKYVELISDKIINDKVVIISGDSGIGKTYIMVELKRLFKDMPSVKVYSFYCGEAIFELRDENIVRYFSSLNGNMSFNYYSFFNGLDSSCFHYFFIDSIDEMKKSALFDIDEEYLPKNVRLIFTTTKRTKGSVVIKPLENNEIDCILYQKCRLHDKEVSDSLLNGLHNSGGFYKLKNPSLLNLYIFALLNFDEQTFRGIHYLMDKFEVKFEVAVAISAVELLKSFNNSFVEELRERLRNNSFNLLLHCEIFLTKGLPLSLAKSIYKILFDEELTDFEYFDTFSNFGNYITINKEGRIQVTNKLLRKLIYDDFKRNPNSNGLQTVLLKSILDLLKTGQMYDGMEMDLANILYKFSNYLGISNFASECISILVFNSNPMGYESSSADNNEIKTLFGGFLKNVLGYLYTSIGEKLLDVFLNTENANAIAFYFYYLFEFDQFSITPENEDKYLKSLNLMTSIQPSNFAKISSKFDQLFKLMLNHYLLYGRTGDIDKLVEKYYDYVNNLSNPLKAILRIYLGSDEDSEATNFLINYSNLCVYKAKEGQLTEIEYFEMMEIVPFIISFPLVFHELMDSEGFKDSLSIISTIIRPDENKLDAFRLSKSLTLYLKYLVYAIGLHYADNSDEIPEYVHLIGKCVNQYLNYCDFFDTSSIEHAIIFTYLYEYIYKKDKTGINKLLSVLESYDGYIPTAYLQICFSISFGRVNNEKVRKLWLLLLARFYENCINFNSCHVVGQIYSMCAIYSYFMNDEIDDQFWISAHLETVLKHTHFQKEFLLDMLKEIYCSDFIKNLDSAFVEDKYEQMVEIVKSFNY